jgi:hypothetical protein
MSVKVIIKREPREVSGRIVLVNEECRLPEGLARTLEDKGLCVIVAVGQPVAMETRVQPDVDVETKIAKKAVAKAAKVKKARDDGKKKAAKK